MSGLPPFVQLRMTATIWPKHLVLTLSTRPAGERWEWDRRIHTWDLPIHAEGLTLETFKGAVDAFMAALPDPD